MNIERVYEAVFIKRLNRFEALVSLNGNTELVHVKNTGRCLELLVSGRPVFVQESLNPKRKTKYDLIIADKEGTGLVYMDSQGANKLMQEWLEGQQLEALRPEKKAGNSRFDFYWEEEGRPVYLEVKNCTLEIDGQGYFPDAKTARGTKHVKELVQWRKTGARCIIAFVMTVNGLTSVLPADWIDPDFAKAYEEAYAFGVEVWFMACQVLCNQVSIVQKFRREGNRPL